jgi:sporulation protein YlmC with PRC-barrel domain
MDYKGEIMKIRALFIAFFFIAALFSGPVLAAERSANSYDGASRGQNGVPQQYNTTPYPNQNQSQMQHSNQMYTGMHRASDLIGQKVISRQGQDLGEIKNLVISQNGQVEYIILSRGGTLGMGGKLVPVPWRAYNLHVQNNKMTADITKEQFQNASAFDDEHWSQMSSPGYDQRVNSYFGTQLQSENQGQSKPHFSEVYPGADVTADGAFDSEHLSHMKNPGYDQRVNGYFGTQPQSENQGQSKPHFSEVYPGADVTADGH